MNFPVHFWSAPEGERLIGMVNYRDMIVVATDRTIYVIKEQGRGLDDHEVQAIKFAPEKVMVER